MPEFKGISMWAKVSKPDEKYNNYVMNLCHLDDDSTKELQSLGIKVRTDNPEYGNYIKATSKYKPKVYDSKGTELPDTFRLNNGSKVKVFLTKKPTSDGAYLQNVMVIELAEYVTGPAPEEGGFEYSQPDPSDAGFEDIGEELL